MRGLGIRTSNLDGRIRECDVFPDPLVVSGAVLARRARFRIPLSNRASSFPAHGSPMVFFAWLRCLRVTDGAPQSVQSEPPEKLASPHFIITADFAPDGPPVSREMAHPFRGK